ncbi:uncharacterized protein LOC6549338 [Drosophila erecta]|uniref:EF-hand domain-containing protein n=1 Tax=Drosophila erecta TaxID=7220 RepID=B3NR49_DROER|nr:uncharacterized protein LOC6549338 [Drosophila erecta]EDV56038.1 uncharacterized protein Dere_GG22426 [Drosophila erecta]
MNQLTFVTCLLFWSGSQAAFQDFVIGPESYEDANDVVPFGQDFSEEMDEDSMVSFQDVQHDGYVDTNLLMKALMQHAKRLGMSLEELASLNMQQEDEESVSELGCSSGQDVFGYPEKPTWRDVLFN